ncbi:MAG: triose-phosphate isomerase, partial [Candidatus Woesearchaeota archaeon]
MKTPIVMINFKTYASSIGTSAHVLAKICETVATQTQKSISICVSAANVHLGQTLQIPVLSQHVDGTDFGAHTGKLLAVDLAQNGAKGSLLNHSENQISLEEIKQGIQACKTANITSVVCADSVEKAERIAELSPDYIAFEPPELIGGDISVTTKPEVISKVVDVIRAKNSTIHILVGAGVKTRIDVEKALELGCQGVLLASGITKAEKPDEVLRDLV